MSSEDELDREICHRRAHLLGADACRVEPGEGVPERLLRRVAFVLVFPPPPQPVMLLGDVGEWEVEREGAKHQRLLLERELRDHLRKLPGISLFTVAPAER